VTVHATTKNKRPYALPTPSEREHFFTCKKLLGDLGTYGTAILLHSVGVHTFKIAHTSAGAHIVLGAKARAERDARLPMGPSWYEKALNEYKDPARTTSSANQPTEPVRFMTSEEWLRPAPESSDEVKKVSAQPSPERLKAIRAVADFNKYPESVFVLSWFTRAGIFDTAPAPIVWPEPQMRWICEHYPGKPEIHTFVCRYCSGQIITRAGHKWKAVHRSSPASVLLRGNSEESFKDLFFQPYLLVRPDRGYEPDEYTSTNYDSIQDRFLGNSTGKTVYDKGYTRAAYQVKRGFDNPTNPSNLAEQIANALPDESDFTNPSANGASYLEIGVRAPNKFKVPEHKCDHGVAWGLNAFAEYGQLLSGNCRVHHPVVFVAKQYSAIRNAVSSQKIKPQIFNVHAGFEFAIVPTIPVLEPSVSPEIIRKFEDRLRIAASRRTCINCGVEVGREMNYCAECAGAAVMTLNPTLSVETPNVYGQSAGYTESKARPLSARNVEFSTVKNFARTIIHYTLSDFTGREVTLNELEFEACVRLSPQLQTMLVRFWLWTHGTPEADIAAIEGLKRNSLTMYFKRHSDLIANATKGLGTEEHKFTL
jgi:hypothetical protein